MTTAKKQTLIQAIKLAHSGKSRDMARALTALAGCPEGGWGETTQGMRQIADYLPLRSARTYTVGHFVEAAYVVGERTMRYDTRDEAAALREAARSVYYDRRGDFVRPDEYREPPCTRLPWYRLRTLWRRLAIATARGTP